MGHLTGRSLPTGIANGMSRHYVWENEIITTDGGYEVRNQRQSTPLRQWDIAMPTRQITDADQIAVTQLWIDSRGGIDTFDHYDEIADETVTVRFDTELTHQHAAGPFYSITQFTIKEVRG
jgi:hypothetical protein